jgi:predicted XRE-type DNA-binding protein
MPEDVSAGAQSEYTVGSDNVFEDLGFDQPDEELAKAKLVMAIGQAIRQRELTEVQAAALLELDQPKVSALLKGRYGEFSTDHLLRLLLALDRDVDIVVKPARARPHVTVISKVSSMAEVSPWYSIKQSVHHISTKCNTGNNIERENRRSGTGGKPLCQECAHLCETATRKYG